MPCPQCGGSIPNNESPGAYPGAISRADNLTELCSACGRAEAVNGVEADIDLWADIFGSGFESYGHWYGLRFLAGAWDTPGIAELVAENDEGGRPLVRTIDLWQLKRAVQDAREEGLHDPCTGDPLGDADWDADAADIVFQRYVYGEVVFS